MEEQFILRVPASVGERLDRLLSESAPSSEDQSLDLSFSGEPLILPSHFFQELVAFILVLPFLPYI